MSQNTGNLNSEYTGVWNPLQQAAYINTIVAELAIIACRNPSTLE
jgi:hypothetical protein